jgi:coiled-coil domain-containing protein 61
LFSLSLISQDFTERWYGEFTAEHIEDVTRRSGALKKLPVFWKMVCNAGRRTSHTVSLEVVVPSEILQSLSELSEENVYIVLTQTTEFDRVKYPMQLRRADFTPDELIATIRRLFAENLRLKERNTIPDSVQSLEHRVAKLNQTLVYMQSEKDQEIDRLQKKLLNLQSSPAHRKAPPEAELPDQRRTPRTRDSSFRTPPPSGTRRTKTPKH